MPAMQQIEQTGSFQEINILGQPIAVQADPFTQL